MKALLWILLIGALLAGLAAWLLHSPPTAPVERALERQLHGVVGPADGYRVQMEGLNPARGTLDRMTAEGTNIRPEGGPVVARAAVDLADVSFDARDQSLTGIGHGRVEVHLLEGDLARFLEQNRHLRQVDLRLIEPDRVRIEAVPEIPQLDLPPGATVGLEGRLAPSRRHVNLVVDRVEALGRDLGRPAARVLQEAVNPIADLSQLPVILELESLRVARGRLEVTAQGRLPPGQRLRGFSP
jgi:hypothetical protein